MLGRMEARVSQHDKQITAIRNLVRDGIEMVRSNAKQIRALTAAQLETDRQIKETNAVLQDLMRSLGRRDKTNGHGKTPKELQ